MANRFSVEASQETPFEQKVAYAFELAQKIPLSARVSLLSRVSEYIAKQRKWTSPDSLITAATPALEQLTTQAIQEQNPEALSELGSLASNILEHNTEKKNQLFIQISQGLEQIATDTKNWSLLVEATKFYQEAYQRQELPRLAVKLEQAARETGDYTLLVEAGNLYTELEDPKAQEIATQLEKIGRETDKRDLLISAGKLFIEDPDTVDRGVELFLEIGCFKAARKAAEYQRLDYELEKRLREAPLSDQEELLKGKGFFNDQVEAWLREGNPKRAIEFLLYKGGERDIGRAAKLIKEHNLQDEVVSVLKNLEPARAVWEAKLLAVSPELTAELADKALRCSDKQIKALEEQIWLIKTRITAPTDRKEKRELRKHLQLRQQAIIDAYLERGEFRDAADYAEKIGNPDQAREIREKVLKVTIKLENYDEAIKLAQELNKPELEFEYLVATGQFHDALKLALKQEWKERIIEMSLGYLDKIYPYYLVDVLSFLHGQEEKTEQIQKAILEIASHLKSHYEEDGSFSKAGEMATILGLNELAAVYQELDSLVPEPLREGGGRGCYITTACCEVMGLRDDCEILRNLRRLRENYISKLPDGPALIALYYQTAPQILEIISPKELKTLFYRAIKPASDLVKEGKFSEAFDLYKRTVKGLIGRYLS